MGCNHVELKKIFKKRILKTLILLIFVNICNKFSRPLVQVRNMNSAGASEGDDKSVFTYGVYA